MTYLTLLRYWYVVIILILGFAVDHFYDQNEEALVKIDLLTTQLELKDEQYKNELNKLKIQYQQDIIDQQKSTLETNAKILDVVDDFNIRLGKQDARTKTVYKEIEKSIPVTISKSCNFGSSWLSIANNHIQESNNPSTSNSK